MNTRSQVTGIILIGMALGACSTANPEPTTAPDPAPTASPVPTATPFSLESSEDLTRSDAQGSVTVDVLPLNLDDPGQTLEFAVSLNTHSIDLSMDLAPLSTLSTDTGLSVTGEAWDAPRGGHHVEGVLAFPSQAGTVRLLDGASRLTLTIRGLDAPERLFQWDLSD